jgi:hypothetical protein
MNTQHNNLLADKAMTERVLSTHSFTAFARPLLDRSPLMVRGDHGVALPEAGDLIA